MSNFEVLQELKTRWGWQDAEWIPLSRPLTFDFYQEWIDQEFHGEMTYLKRHLPLKAEATGLLAEARSILMVSKSYVPHFAPHGLLPGLRQAAYAQNEDYHEVFGKELREAAARLSELFPNHHFRSGTDSLPVMERDHAARAGLGWVGKNTCLIHPKKGSFFLIGEILSTLPVDFSTAPVPDFCGTCRRCIEICPTDALIEPRKLDARRCISYWTIESKAVPPLDLAAQFGDWFFGCDLCQSVCPWNQKPFRGQSALRTELLPDVSGTDRESLLRDLRWCLETDETEMRSHLRDTPLGRAKAFGLRRNALIVIRNRRLHELKDATARWTEDPALGKLARWTLDYLTNSGA